MYDNSLLHLSLSLASKNVQVHGDMSCVLPNDQPYNLILPNHSSLTDALGGRLFLINESFCRK